MSSAPNPCNSEIKTSESERYRYHCNSCDAKFTFACYLKIHQRVHTGEKPFQCTNCNKRFKRLQQCKVHEKLEHEKFKIHCPDCGKPFGTEANLFRHRIATHMNVKRWICGYCGSPFAQSQDLRKHLLSCHEFSLNFISNKTKKSFKEIYIIPEIGSLALTEANLKKIKLISSEERYKLLNCWSIFDQKQTNNCSNELVKVKKIIVRKMKSKQSNLNGAIANISYQMNDHLSSKRLQAFKESPRKQYSCEKCHLLFNKEDCLKNHILQNHSQVFQCYACHQNFICKNMCIDHIKTEHQQPLQSIDVLGNYFTTDSLLQTVPLLTLNSGSLFQTPQSVPLLLQPSITCDTGNLIQFQEESTNQSSKLKHVFQPVLINQPLVVAKPPKITVPLVPIQDSVTASQTLNMSQEPLLLQTTDCNIKPENQFVTDAQSEINKGCFSNTIMITDDHASKVAPNLLYTSNNLEKKKKTVKLHDSFAMKEIHIGAAIDQHSTSGNIKQTSTPANIMVISRKTGNVVQDYKCLNVQPGEMEEQYQCAICDKVFSTSTKLSRHSKTHANPKHFCEICNKGFVEKCNLKVHMLSHNNENPKECVQCGMRFRYSRDLKEHLDVHLGVQKHGCDKCDIKFLRQRDFSRHIKEHHLGVLYRCRICGQSFKRKSYLERFHMATHLSTNTKRKGGSTCKLCKKKFDSKKERLKHECMSSQN